MPSTVNGIGTFYYGHRDVAVRAGNCRHCGTYGNLESYTTRLWFVVIFIPVIPLKRVRVLDFCRRCSRHWVVKPEEYEMSRQLAVSGAMEQYRAEPSVEGALALHAQFLRFHMHQEADKFRIASEQAHPANAELLTGFAGHLDQIGRTNDATPLYEQAHALEPDATNVRFHLAWRRINENRLDEAYQLLDYLREPGAGRSFNVGLLETLARSYQKGGNHERVLELGAHVLRENPSLGEQHAFRKLIATSERALKQPTSLLPEKAFSIRGLFDKRSGANPPWVSRVAFLSIAVGLFLLGMAGLNEYHRRHRTLHVVNLFADPVSVSIDGGAPVAVGSRLAIPVSEGTHRIRLSGPITKEAEISLRSSYWSRWTHSPQWIFNIEQLANIFRNDVYYAVNPRPAEQAWLHEELNFVPHVDYLFEPPPASMKVDNKNSVVKKVQVGLAMTPPATTYLGLRGSRDPGVSQTFAEGHLNRNPNDSSLLQLYSDDRQSPETSSRIAAFLKAGLWRQPISVPWHRAYQNLKSVVADEAALIAEYDAQLKQAPDDAMLLYLRGRVGATRDDQLKYFHAAARKDPQLGWPAMGLAYDAANRGEWAEARLWGDKAAGTLSADPSFRSLWHVVRLANGEAAVLEPVYRQQLHNTDLLELFPIVYQLADCLAAQEKYDEARQFVNQWLGSSGLFAHPETALAFQTMQEYVCGELDPPRLGNAPQPPLSKHEFSRLLARVEPEAALQVAGNDAATAEWTGPISVSLCFFLKGNREEADAWRNRACEKMHSGDSDLIRAAALLHRDNPPSDKELDDVVLRITDTPLFLAALGQKFPERRSEIYQRAARLNVSRQPPYLLVKKVVEQP